MSWMRNKLTPAPHLCDPKETVKSSKAYYLNSFGIKGLEASISLQMRAIEHEQAILTGMEQALAELYAAEAVRKLKGYDQTRG